MATPGNTYVQYFVPYDGDVEDHPNVFLVRKPSKGLTLADIQQVREGLRCGRATPRGRSLATPQYDHGCNVTMLRRRL